MRAGRGDERDAKLLSEATEAAGTVRAVVCGRTGGLFGKLKMCDEKVKERAGFMRRVLQDFAALEP